jgi:cell division protein FtsL
LLFFLILLFLDRIIPAWNKWETIQSIIKEQDEARIEKENKVFDLSNLIVQKSTSRSVSSHSVEN